MSYARWAEDSDVYVYLDCSGFLMCAACPLVDEERWNFEAYRTQDMIDHLKEHKAMGHQVLDYTFEALADEAARTDKDIEEMHKDCPKTNCAYERAKILFV